MLDTLRTSSAFNGTAIRRSPFLLLLFVLLAFALAAHPLQASPVVGAPILASGRGSSHVEILPSYTSHLINIYLVSPVFVPIGTNQQVGKVVQLGHFPAGTELVFKIVVDTGDTFYSGPGAGRNPDDLDMAAVEAINPVQSIVGFEDYPYLDNDFNDAVFRVKR